jgi:L-ascorbate metabolism protein UlaG (beta-lactamase superfamily)
MNHLLDGVSRLKHSTIRIRSDQVIYFDPFRIDGNPGDADVIFISHIHHDHLSIEDIKKLAKKDTVLVAPADCAEKAGEAGFACKAVAPSQSCEVGGIQFSTVPAYNIGKKFHPKENNWVGYVVRINNIAYYFAGDTDKIPEMKDIKADVAFLPVGGIYTMTWKEAAEAANLMKPTIAVPMHFAEIVGTAEDAENFTGALDASITGKIL